MPKISVVVATYNRKKLLLDLLGDLARQKLPPGTFDVIVVDDGSKEAVRGDVEAHAAAVPYAYEVRVLEQPNAGQASARHAGIVAATGTVIVVLDDDMALPDDFLAAHLAEHDAGFSVVLGHIRPSPELEKMPLFERFHAQQLDHFVANVKRGEAVPGAALCTGNVSFRRDDYLAVGGFDRTLARSEDRDLGIRLEARGARFTFSERAYTTHRSDHTSLEVWLRRAFLYGIYDSRISKKHGHVKYVDPWRFLFLVNPVSRPLLLLATAAPPVGKVLSKGAMAASMALDARGMEGLAIRGTTLVYGLEYFLGMREEAGSLRRSLQNLAKYVRK